MYLYCMDFLYHIRARPIVNNELNENQVPAIQLFAMRWRNK